MSSVFYNEIASMIDEYGWWVVLRSFDLTKHSKYWNSTSHEAVGGPPYEYNDIILKGRRVEKVRNDPEQTESRQQNTNVYQVVFYLLGNIRPKKEDVIMEIHPSLKQIGKPPKKIRPVELFDIEHAEPKIEHGVIVTKCYCRKKTPVNDETLVGEIPVKHKKIYKR